jgi:hypothetical protein
MTGGGRQIVPYKSFSLYLNLSSGSSSIQFTICLLGHWCDLCLGWLHSKHLSRPGCAYGLLAGCLGMFKLQLAHFPVEVTSWLGVTVGTRGCFPQPCAGLVELLGFHSQVVALGLSSCFSTRVAKLTTSFKVKAGCIQTLSYIATHSPLINLATCWSFVSMRSIRADRR